MKKMIALLAVLLTVFLAACSKEPEKVDTPDTPTAAPTTDVTTEPATEAPTEGTEPTTLANDRFNWETAGAVTGTWGTTIVLDGSLLNLPEMETKVTMDLKYQLNADATYVRGVDQAQYESALNTYEAAVESFMLDRFYATFVAEKKLENMKQSKIDELWEQTEKADAQEQAKRFVEDLRLDYRFSQLNSSGDYYVENGEIWFSMVDGTYECCGYTLSDAGLTITSVPNPRMYQQLKLDIPMLLTKAA